MRALDYKDIDTEKSTVRSAERDCPSEHSGDYLNVRVLYHGCDALNQVFIGGQNGGGRTALWKVCE